MTEFERKYDIPKEEVLPTHCNKCGKEFKQKGVEICVCEEKVKPPKKGQKF